MFIFLIVCRKTIKDVNFAYDHAEKSNGPSGINTTDALLMTFRRPFSEVKHDQSLDAVATRTILSR